ncbi:hypothetical protein [Maribacter sp. 4G9]|uniref:hypothetical protein n=1 Tax=Maribacter sp. 4G9 TaxID=1889777 RepID=UPI000F4EA7CF|nr:hypothetical protein [Maribacter sp. 4G9]
MDLSSLVGTDDQTASEVNITDAGGNFTATDVEGALSELAAGSTDDQNLTGATLDGSNQLQIDIEGGSSATVDLSSLVGTDDQTASEVDSDTPVDVDGDGSSEATVEDVIQAIAPITSKAARIFYPPSIAIDASVLVNNVTVDLYQEYLDQYGGSAANFTASAGAPGTVPTYGRTELYYYVTFADPAVLNIDLIDANGNMQYDVIGTPPDYNSLINVVFVVK